MRPIFIALDFNNKEETMRFLEKFRGRDDLYVKVGMELFYMEGPAFVRELRDAGYKIFLDLKLYDIPNTVEQAMKQLGQLGVHYVTVHASGGAEMLRAARRGLEAGSSISGLERPKLLAITQLTSTNKEQMQKEQLVQASLTKSVVHLAGLAFENGADGVISSAFENELIHDETSESFLKINPGIRLQSDARDDQKRVVTPNKAAQMGSDGIVVGRSITKAADPLKVYQTIKTEWENR